MKVGFLNNIQYIFIIDFISLDIIDNLAFDLINI